MLSRNKYHSGSFNGPWHGATTAKVLSCFLKRPSLWFALEGRGRLWRVTGAKLRRDNVLDGHAPPARQVVTYRGEPPDISYELCLNIGICSAYLIDILVLGQVEPLIYLDNDFLCLEPGHI